MRSSKLIKCLPPYIMKWIVVFFFLLVCMYVCVYVCVYVCMYVFHPFTSSYLALKLGYINKTHAHIHKVELKTLYFNFV